MFLGKIFQIQTQTINGRPNPTRVKKIFWPGPITNSNASKLREEMQVKDIQTDSHNGVWTLYKKY